MPVSKTRRKGISPKVQARWLGPHVVTEKINQVTYKLQVARDKSLILHFDLLKSFCDAEIPLCVERSWTCVMDKDGAALPGAARVKGAK